MSPAVAARNAKMSSVGLVCFQKPFTPRLRSSSWAARMGPSTGVLGFGPSIDHDKYIWNPASHNKC
eukprot:12925456-Prorocentrum_lima.AAC.1